MPFIKTAAGKAWITLQIANYCWWCWQNYAGQHWAEQWAWARVVISVMTKKWQIFFRILWFFYFSGKNIHFLALIFKCLGKKAFSNWLLCSFGGWKNRNFSFGRAKVILDTDRSFIIFSHFFNKKSSFKPTQSQSKHESKMFALKNVGGRMHFRE